MNHLVWLWKSRCYSGLEWARRSYIFSWLPGGTDTADLRASKGLCISPTSHNLETSHYDTVSLSVYGCALGTAQHWGQVLPLSPTSCVTLNKGFDFTKPPFSYIWNRKNNIYLRERMWGFNEIINIKQYAPIVDGWRLKFSSWSQSAIRILLPSALSSTSLPISHFSQCLTSEATCLAKHQRVMSRDIFGTMPQWPLGHAKLAGGWDMQSLDRKGHRKSRNKHLTDYLQLVISSSF